MFSGYQLKCGSATTAHHPVTWMTVCMTVTAKMSQAISDLLSDGSIAEKVGGKGLLVTHRRLCVIRSENKRTCYTQEKTACNTW